MYARALAHLPDWMDDVPALPVPELCPVTLDQPLTEGVVGQAGAPT